MKISNELGQSLPGLQIYPSFAQNSESEYLAKRSKKISSKIDSSVIRDPNNPLGLINYGENLQLCHTSLVFLPVFRGYINKLSAPVKGVSENQKTFQ